MLRLTGGQFGTRWLKAASFTASLALFLVTAGPAEGADRGRFAARIFDEAGEPIGGVDVTITLPETGTIWELTSDGKGRFQFLPPDPNLEYTFRLEAEGYQTLEMTIDIDIKVPRSFELRRMVGDPAAVERYNEGADLLEAGDAEGALSSFDAALAIQPDLAVGHLGRAAVFLANGDLPSAEAAARTALDHDPANAEAILVTYEILLEVGREAEALEAVATLSGCDPRRAAAALAARGEKLVVGPGRGTFEGVLDAALKADKNDAQSHYLRGTIALVANDLATATGHFQRFVELAPDDPKAEATRRQLLMLGD